MSTMPQQAGIPLTGHSLAPLLKTAAGEECTGFFTIRTHEAIRTVSLLHGRIVFAGSNDREERLNSVLLRRNLVSLEDLTSAVEIMLRQNRRLGEVLVSRGTLDEKGLVRALRTQVTEIVCRLLTLRAAEIGFRTQPVPDHSDVAYRTPVNALIRASLFQVRDVHHVMDEIGGPTATVAPTALFATEIASSGLRPEHAALIPYLDEPREVVQVCSNSDLPDFDVCRLLWVLLTIGALSRLA